MTTAANKLGCVFPGQGSQFVGMCADFAKRFPVFAETLREANDVLGFALDELMSEGPAEALDQTLNTQPALLAVSVGLWRTYRELGGVEPACLAGHSLGEYSALVAAQAISFSAALKLVRARAEYMQAAVPPGTGAMAAVLGLADERVREVCATIATTGDVVECANFNAPGQVVIAGHRAAIDRAGPALKSAGAKRVLPLSVSVPSHCSLMQPAAERLSEDLATVAIQAPCIPVLHNVDASLHSDPDDIRRVLVLQLHSPVRWSECVTAMVAQYGSERVLECGPGKVLAGLIPRIVADVRVNNAQNADALVAWIVQSDAQSDQRKAG